jgi:hypothetical protein
LSVVKFPFKLSSNNTTVERFCRQNWHDGDKYMILPQDSWLGRVSTVVQYQAKEGALELNQVDWNFNLQTLLRTRPLEHQESDSRSRCWQLISNAIFGVFFCKVAKMSSPVLNHAAVIDVLRKMRMKQECAHSLAILDESKA